MASNLDDHSNDRLFYKNELINQEDVKPLQDVSGNIANKCTLSIDLNYLISIIIKNNWLLNFKFK